MAANTSAGEVVGRIAYLSSDVVVSVQPALGQDSEFSATLRQCSTKKEPSLVTSGLPEVIPVRHNADPLLSAFEPLQKGKLVTLTTTSPTLLQSVPHLYNLARYPIVIHVSVQPEGFPDFGDITAIRECGFSFLYSESLQEVQDLSVTAHALAIKSGTGVIHFFDSNRVKRRKSSTDDSAELLKSLLDFGAVDQIHDTPSNSTGIYLTRPSLSASAKAGGEQLQTNGHAETPETSGSQINGTDSTKDDDKALAKQHERLGSDDVFKIATDVWAKLQERTGRKYTAFDYTGPPTADAVIFVFGADTSVFAEEMDTDGQSDEYDKAGIVTVRLYRPWISGQLLDVLPKAVKKIAVLERVRSKTLKWGPVLMDVLMTTRSDVATQLGRNFKFVAYRLGYIDASTIRQALRGIFQNLRAEHPIQNLDVGKVDWPPETVSGDVLQQPELEHAYMKILKQLFGERLYIANRLGENHAGISANISSSPEYGFGSLLARLDRKKRFVKEVQVAARGGDFTTDFPGKWLSKWAVSATKPEAVHFPVSDVIARLSTDGSPAASRLLESRRLFYKESQWLIGSDAWAYDLANSGVHHVLASGENVNMLIIDSQPYSDRAAADAARRKKDIGLYAMNFGNAYVASVAVYSSYTQVLQALAEAENFEGPSIVLAYLPYFKEDDSPLTVLQETKRAVDSGYWPLYRWNPQGETDGDENFKLDSERVKKELEDFLRRDNYLTQLVRRYPEFSSNLSGSYGSEVRQQQKRDAKDAYSRLLDGLAGAPLLVLFASDNGNSEGLSKRLGFRGKARGLKTMVMTMDDYPLEDLPNEKNVVMITSTAGQGEFPQNGRGFWEGIKGSTDLDLSNINFAVFALGDSHYWPRKEDKLYYNKPGKDLHARVIALGGKPMTECGMGDDQDPDGYQTGYQEWEPVLWKAMGVDKVEGLPEEPAPITNEDIKIESNFLRGTIAEGLQDASTGAISASDQQLTKFHGTYMQDDRDLRDERKAQGLEPAYSFMIRCRLAGGVATPQQWLQMDSISSTLGNETMKLTTRQTFQFHGVIKGKLRPAMQAINKALMTTLAACGDVNRNVMCSCLPENSEYHRQVLAVSQKISDHLLPSTSAYHEIWLKDEDTNKKTQVAGDALVDQEPLYGPTYLPRKFKITIAIPPHNDTDVYAHDIGLIAIQDKSGSLEGFNLLAGGGMGVTHNNKKTYPRTGSMLGYVSKDQVHIACEKVMLVQRDHGDRKNRKHARLKYTIDDMGVDVFRSKVEELWGTKFEEARPFKFKSNIDTFGWQKDEKGLNHFTFFIENGRIEDTATFPMKTGLVEIAKIHKGEFRLTGNQHLTLSNVSDAALPEIKALMSKYKLDNTDFSALRLSSSACVAFPTCGLAMAESERYLPELITKLEGAVEEAGLRQESIVMRMTGCPNGCARPWLAEVGFVGKAYGAYNMYLGGGYHGQRLNKLYRSSIKEEEILEIMKPLLKRYAIEREEGERFGDFCIRIGMIKETRHGTDFHENTAEQESEEEA